MIKNRYWEMEDKTKELHTIKANKEAIQKEEILELFVFEVRRYKAEKSKREHLEILAKVKDEDYGTIEASLINLESEIVGLREYGIALDRIKFIELYKLIKNNYYSFEPIKIKENEYEVTEEVINGVLTILGEYIDTMNIEPKAMKDRNGNEFELYNIPLAYFNDELKESEIENYSFIEIRKVLKEKKYIHTNKGRFDYMINDNGKRVKMVSVYKNVITQILGINNKEQE